MNIHKDMYSLLYHKADHFMQRTTLKYLDIAPYDLPNVGGVYLISQKEMDGTESYLSINLTTDLRHEILTRREAFLATFTGGNLKFAKGKNPRFVKHTESLEHLKENCILRFVVETELKEQLALMAVVAVMLRPWSNGS